MTVTPQISVVVSSRDRAERLAQLLESLRTQSLDRAGFELIVVDNGSEDGTAALLEREQDRGELPLSVIARQRGQGPAAARNQGWRAARAPLVAFTDDDCRAHSGWLQALCETAQSNPGAIVQGRTETAADEAAQASVFTRTVEVTEPGPFFHTCNIAYPRELLDRLDGFDERTFGRQPGGEDTDLAWRAIGGGADAVFTDAARVFHAVNEFSPIEGLRFPLRWSDTMAVFRRHPAMRSRLHRGLFWKRSHELLLWALLGLLISLRFRPALLLAYPYARNVLRRTRQLGSPPSHAPYLALQDAVETYATVRGALRHRVPVL